MILNFANKCKFKFVSRNDLVIYCSTRMLSSMNGFQNKKYLLVAEPSFFNGWKFSISNIRIVWVIHSFFWSGSFNKDLRFQKADIWRNFHICSPIFSKKVMNCWDSKTSSIMDMHHWPLMRFFSTINKFLIFSLKILVSNNWLSITVFTRHF